MRRKGRTSGKSRAFTSLEITSRESLLLVASCALTSVSNRLTELCRRRGRRTSVEALNGRPVHASLR